jgi:hypothetical protein
LIVPCLGFEIFVDFGAYYTGRVLLFDKDFVKIRLRLAPFAVQKYPKLRMKVGASARL